MREGISLRCPRGHISVLTWEPNTETYDLGASVLAATCDVCGHTELVTAYGVEEENDGG